MIRSLPPDSRQQLDVMLVQGKTARECVVWLRAQGLCSQIGEASLCRAVRRYRVDAISIPEAARAEAMQKAPPRLRARIAEQVTAHEQLAKLKKIAQSRDKAFWVAVEKTPPGLAAVSESLRKSAESAFAMHERITRLAMDCGIVPRAAQQIHITAEAVVIANDRDAQQLFEALYAYFARTVDRDRSLHSRSHTEGELAAVEDLLAMRAFPKPTMVPSIEQTIEVRRQRADKAVADMERRIAELTADESRAEPIEDDGPRIPVIDEYDEPRVEVLPRGVPVERSRGRVIDIEPDDGMPEPIRTRGELRARGEQVVDDGMPQLSDVW
jgi:hypothetical protein